MLATAPQQKQMAAAGLRTVFRIFDEWGLGDEDAMRILGIGRSTFYNYKRDPNCAKADKTLLERLSYVLGIYKALQILLPDPAIASRWITAASDAPIFGGAAPIDRLRAGQVGDLYLVRTYLDAQRGGWT